MIRIKKDQQDDEDDGLMDKGSDINYNAIL